MNPLFRNLGRHFGTQHYGATLACAPPGVKNANLSLLNLEQTIAIINNFK